jgi:hypothetical protein
MRHPREKRAPLDIARARYRSWGLERASLKNGQRFLDKWCNGFKRFQIFFRHARVGLIRHHGIMLLPSRRIPLTMASWICSSVQLPSPVSLSARAEPVQTVLFGAPNSLRLGVSGQQFALHFPFFFIVLLLFFIFLLFIFHFFLLLPFAEETCEKSVPLIMCSFFSIQPLPTQY